MKVAVTATSSSLDAPTDPHFGRCTCFVLVNTDDMSFEAVDNANNALGHGAGIQSAQLMASKGASTVLTGSVGPNAHSTLSAAGIGVVVGCSGTVREVVEQWKAGQLEIANAPNAPGHGGMGGGMGRR